MADLDLDEIYNFTIKLARDAGDMIKAGQQRRFEMESTQEEKLNSVDLVTEVDKAVEAFITKKIKDAYPSHQFIGEETYAGEKITDEPTWIVEQALWFIGNGGQANESPIDGTTNFVHGYPMVCTSIGLTVKGVPVIGVIYNPFLDQLYSAAKGRGAWLNEHVHLPVTGKSKPLTDLGQALIAVEYGSSRSSPTLPSKCKTFQTLAASKDEGGKMAHSLRSAGSAAINIALVASGGLDIYWEIGCWPWDVCAGICILYEAGGVAFGSKSKPLSGEVDADLLAGRKYLFIRGIKATESESELEVQQRFAKEFYDTTEDVDA